MSCDIKTKEFVSYRDDMKFIIEEDLPKVGAYLYVYEGDNCVFDCLQDSIDICKEIALEQYNVPLESWKNSSR
ncbi:hypothetical protein [Thiolapillus sp.]|uniref:hypothetical protein n=2 Tax=Thiolapillus sp. TaxID=2017437 RepID=UPI00263BC92B|nr:hypothetical protein [Thiolapillus sp.]